MHVQINLSDKPYVSHVAKNSSFALLSYTSRESVVLAPAATNWLTGRFLSLPEFCGRPKGVAEKSRAGGKQMQERRSAFDAYREAWFSFFWVFFLLKKIWKTKKEWTYYTTKSPLLKWKKIRLKVLGKSLVGAPCARRVREAGGPSSSPLLVSLHYHIRGRCSAETMLHACRNKGPERGKKELDLRGMGKSLSRRLQRAEEQQK